MTASLLYPAFLTERYQRHPLHEMQTLGRSVSCGRQAAKIKKNLFGAPQPGETTKHCTEQLEKYQEKAAQKWDYDFRNGRPLNSASTQFTWERVPKTEVVPQMYTLCRAAHVREQPKITSCDLLMDERADRANSSSCDDSQDESIVTFEAPSASAAPSNVAAAAIAAAATAASAAAAAAAAALPQKRKRQPKITEYMKQRKRKVQTSKKISPSKRARTTSASSSSTTSLRTLHSSFKTLQRNH